MEIITTTRTINVNSLDVLDLEELIALQSDQAANDPAIQEQIKQAFQQRREATIEPQQFSFTVAPLDLINQMQALEFARTMGLWDGKSQGLKTHMLSLVVFLVQTQAWSGFEAAGEPLSCTRENKVLVFGQASLVVQAALEKFNAEEEAERKNLKTSPAG